jgi:hypothetical protein
MVDSQYRILKNLVRIQRIAHPAYSFVPCKNVSFCNFPFTACIYGVFNLISVKFVVTLSPLCRTGFTFMAGVRLSAPCTNFLNHAHLRKRKSTPKDAVVIGQADRHGVTFPRFESFGRPLSLCQPKWIFHSRMSRTLWYVSTIGYAPSDIRKCSALR